MVFEWRVDLAVDCKVQLLVDLMRDPATVIQQVRIISFAHTDRVAFTKTKCHKIACIFAKSKILCEILPYTKTLV